MMNDNCIKCRQEIKGRGVRIGSKCRICKDYECLYGKDPFPNNDDSCSCCVNCFQCEIKKCHLCGNVQGDDIASDCKICKRINMLERKDGADTDYNGNWIDSSGKAIGSCEECVYCKMKTVCRDCAIAKLREAQLEKEKRKKERLDREARVREEMRQREQERKESRKKAQANSMPTPQPIGKEQDNNNEYESPKDIKKEIDCVNCDEQNEVTYDPNTNWLETKAKCTHCGKLLRVKEDSKPHPLPTPPSSPDRPSPDKPKPSQKNNNPPSPVSLADIPPAIIEWFQKNNIKSAKLEKGELIIEYNNGNFQKTDEQFWENNKTQVFELKSYLDRKGIKYLAIESTNNLSPKLNIGLLVGSVMVVMAIPLLIWLVIKKINKSDSKS